MNGGEDCLSRASLTSVAASAEPPLKRSSMLLAGFGSKVLWLTCAVLSKRVAVISGRHIEQQRSARPDDGKVARSGRLVAAVGDAVDIQAFGGVGNHQPGGAGRT